MQTSWVDLLHSTLSCLLLSLESGVDCPCPWFHANSLLLASLLSSRQLPSAGSRRQRPPAVQRKLLSAGSRRQLPFASPYHFRIRRDFRSKNPLSDFAPKQTKESSALAAYPHSATNVISSRRISLFISFPRVLVRKWTHELELNY